MSPKDSNRAQADAACTTKSALSSRAHNLPAPTSVLPSLSVYLAFSWRKEAAWVNCTVTSARVRSRWMNAPTACEFKHAFVFADLLLPARIIPTQYFRWWLLQYRHDCPTAHAVGCVLGRSQTETFCVRYQLYIKALENPSKQAVMTERTSCPWLHFSEKGRPPSNLNMLRNDCKLAV